MPKATLAIAAVLLAAMTVMSAAQGPSYESRGYGGPLYVGPNFQAGGQHSAPVYDSPSTSKKTYRQKRTYRANKSRKERAKPTETAKSAEADTENSSISRADGGPEKTDAEKPVDTAKGSDEIETENSTISSAALNGAKTASEESGAAVEPQAKQNVGCKKYFPTAGMTLTVPCD